MITRSRRTQLLGLGVSSVLLLSLVACGSDEPQNFITPTATPSGSATSPIKPVEDVEDMSPSDAATAFEEALQDLDGSAPFALKGLDSVPIPQEAKDAFPETDLTTAAPAAMTTLELALTLPSVWVDAPRVVLDYEPLHNSLSSAQWTRLVDSLAQDNAVGEALAPGWNSVKVGLVTADGKPFTVTPGTPPIVTASLPVVNVVTNAEFFGDPTPRIGIATVYALTFDGESEGSPARTTYELAMDMYVVPDGEGGWLLDNFIVAPGKVVTP